MLFRWAEPAALTAANGETVAGRGVISAVWKEAEEPGPKRHALGALPRPLYRFLGWFPEPERLPGGTVRQGEFTCRVLDARPVILGGKTLGVRALLEREEENHDDG